jgi:nucleotide-binding universal stress UspA family protein
VSRGGSLPPVVGGEGCNIGVTIKKILLPVDFPHPSLRVMHQAAMVARHFHAEIVMLHVVTTESRAAGVVDHGPEHAGWDLLADLTIRRMVVRGDAAQTIVQTAQEEQADLIMMAPHGGTFEAFLQGSVTATREGTECPIWTDAYLEESPVQDWTIRNVLCAVNVNPHNHKTVSWAAHIAGEFGAHLSLAHVTAGVESWGPGGSYVDARWQATLVGDASQYLAQLQQEMGITADTFIGSGHVPTVLSQAVKQTRADLLVTGSRPYGVHLRTHAYAIMCGVPIPVLSV